MKLNYLLAAVPLVASTIAAPNPEGEGLEARDQDIIGRVSATMCGEVQQIKGKTPASVNNVWFMFTYETTCKDGHKVVATADQSCAQDGFWESIKKQFTFNLEAFGVDSGEFKGKMKANIDLFSEHPGSKISFNNGPEIPLGTASNVGHEGNDHAKCKSACLKKLSADSDGEVSIWENHKDIPKDFGCEKHGGAKTK